MFFVKIGIFPSLLLRVCYTSPVAENSLFSDDPTFLNDDISSAFDSNSLTSNTDPDLLSDYNSSESSLNLQPITLNSADFNDLDSFNNLGNLDDDDASLIAAAGDGVIDSNNLCPNVNSGGDQSRKRNDQCEPSNAPSINELTLPNLIPSQNKPDPPKYEEGNDIFGPRPSKTDTHDYEKCGGFLHILQRTMDVCCDGPRGPFTVDPFGRLIYRNIGGCEPGNNRICWEPVSACCAIWVPTLNKGIGVNCVEVGDNVWWND